MKTKQGDTTVIDIRGWGYLTGRGALNMSDDLACEAHDAFANWVVAALNSYSANAKGHSTKTAGEMPESKI